MTTASVIIATFNRAGLLDECLAHLARQAFATGDEVIVADNGSTDHTAAIVARHLLDFPVALTRIVVDTPGKSHAVAAALRIARGEIVMFTDDDVNVGAGWMKHLRQAFSDAGTGLAGGPVEPRWQAPAPAWLRVAQQQRLGAPLGLLDYGTRESRLGPRTLLGANLAVRHAVLRQLGGYATHLGKLRGTLLSGEDHELCQRVQAAGFDARYVPEARVTHWVPTERMRLGYFVRWFYWSGITQAAMEASAPCARLLGIPRHLVRQFAGGLVAGFAQAARGQTAAAVDRALDSAFAAGYAAFRWGLTPALPAPAVQAATAVAGGSARLPAGGRA
ncbi:MAG TPA: glycosyltransferase [Vicinamibacterales bacterium]|nr:glycosyltransferase [Vicinamibacterales bacterium]